MNAQQTPTSGQTATVDPPVPRMRTARDRARVEVTNEIMAVARRQLSEAGASALSLRSVAREVGMVSSAVYRYFPSRDDLLTALIVDAYRSVGEAAITAADAVPRADLAERWMAITSAVRLWAIASPHEYGLIFGTPVPGYLAPVDTIDPATIVPLALLEVLVDAAATNASTSWKGRRTAAPVKQDLAALRDGVRSLLPGIGALGDGTLAQGLMAWTQLIGMISFELFGHLHNVIVDFGAYFEQQTRNIAIDLGLTARHGSSARSTAG
ncbi:MAG: transcriptional regulator, TetR family [Ilumatobacteraceae bacterium]|nr:transcriptional regulator, TetR family [Ilumatobacteraceae bacterium]